MDTKRMTLAASMLVAAGLLGSSFAASPDAVRRTETAMADGNYEYAYAEWKKIMARRPGDRDAAAALARIDRTARTIFEEASRIHSSDAQRAKDLLRTVVLISDPRSELNRQARQLLGDEL